MQVDITKLDSCCFPAVHSIGSRGLEMFDVFYINVPDIRRLVALEFACRVDEGLRKSVYSLLGDHMRRIEIDSDILLFVERKSRKRVEEIMDEYCDGVYVGSLDGGDAVDDIINAVDRYTMLLLGAFCAEIRYAFAGAYAVSLCKVNNSESYVIRLDETGEEFDKTNPRKMAQSNTWQGDLKVPVSFTFMWLGKRVRFGNAAHLEIRKGR